MSAEAPPPTEPVPPGRTRERLDRDWRFAPGSRAGAGQLDFDDAAWEPVTLTHTWNAVDAFARKPGYFRGEAWYRRGLDLAEELRGRSLFLVFEGAESRTEVFVNGRLAGSHAGGTTAFAMDVTALVRFGAPNRLAVRVDNAPDPDLPPLVADYNFYGGLYRDVWLLAAAPIHFTLADHGSPGVIVEADAITPTSARIRVRGALTNSTGGAERVAVVVRVLAPDGREALASQAWAHAPPGVDTTFEIDAGVLARPLLWSPDTPHLYEARVELRTGDGPVDEVRQALGLRWFRVDPGHGLFLNGAPLRLRGTNRHQDREGHGSAVPTELQREDLRRIKADGFNFVRLAHYPQSEAVLEECDRLGLVVWEEVPVVNQVGMALAFEANARRMLVEMIRQHRHHPSVFFWGLANEALLIRPDPLPEGHAARAAAIVRGLNGLAHSEDSARLTAATVSLEEVDDGSGIQDLPDVLGLNLYFGWYYRRAEELGAWLDEFHARHPARPVIVSEYGADGDERVHAVNARPLDFSIETQQHVHESTLPQLEARPWLVGSAVWNQFDFGSTARDGTRPALNQKGLYHFDRRPKDVAFYYRAKLAKYPVLHIAARDWPKRAGSRPGDERFVVAVYTNFEDVELLRGSESLGVRRAENAAARWEVALRPGENVLVARGMRDGRGVEDRCDVIYEDRSIALRAIVLGTAGPREITLAMNASARQYLDSAGTAWEACRDHSPGSWGPVGGEPAMTSHRIFGTHDDALFQATLEGASRIQFDVPDGEYDLELLLCEICHDSPGARVFGASVNGVPVFAGLDLARECGRYVAAIRKARVCCSGRAGLTVELEATSGRTTVSAVKLVSRPAR